jgi:hypothetical protein
MDDTLKPLGESFTLDEKVTIKQFMNALAPERLDPYPEKVKPSNITPLFESLVPMLMKSFVSQQQQVENIIIDLDELDEPTLVPEDPD